jgi:transcriptional antiterminator RfaH
MPVTIEAGKSGWFVLRTKQKCEHLAAIHLMKYADLDDVFSPRIRFEKATRRGKVWFIEALFPGYIFARFDLNEKLRAVNATNSVFGVLRFADLYPQVHDDFIGQLRAEFPEEDQELRVIHQPIAEGDEVIILDGVMTGVKTIVTRILSGKERVRVLLEWLGEERETEVCYTSILPTRLARSEL